MFPILQMRTQRLREAKQLTRSPEALLSKKKSNNQDLSLDLGPHPVLLTAAFLLAFTSLSRVLALASLVAQW